MAQGVNKVILIGNVGQDPETKYMPSGGAVTNLSIATSESWKDKQTGQPQERTEWHRVVFFNRLAEIASEYVRKGSKVYVEGALRTRQWEQDGVKRYSTEIVASQMQMLDSRQGNAQGGGQDTGVARLPLRASFLFGPLSSSTGLRPSSSRVGAQLPLNLLVVSLRIARIAILNSQIEPQVESLIRSRS